MVGCQVASKYKEHMYATNERIVATKWSEKIGFPCTHNFDHYEISLVVDEVVYDV